MKIKIYYGEIYNKSKINSLINGELTLLSLTQVSEDQETGLHISKLTDPDIYVVSEVVEAASLNEYKNMLRRKLYEHATHMPTSNRSGMVWNNFRRL
jgi:hypothetical protein